MMKVVLMMLHQVMSLQCVLHQDNVRHDEGSLNVCSIRYNVRYYMMKVVLMCAPLSGQCQVLHDEGSLNVCSIRTMSGIT